MKKILKNYKTLVSKLRFSLELEAEFPSKVDIDTLRARYRKLLRSWTVVHDGSMMNGLEFKPKDINHLHFNKESFDEISEILHIIRKHKGQVDGKCCGLHIHIDMTKISNEELIRIIKEMIAKQEYMIKDFNVDHDRLEHYCKRILSKDIRGLNINILNQFRDKEGIEKYIPYLNSKYYLLNVMSLQEFNTIEFRLFNGTKYLREIKKIIKYLFDFLIYALERN